MSHYSVLGLQNGSNLTLSDITKAYKRKALILHPDKNPNNPNAAFNFTQLNTSFEALKQEYRDGAKRRRVVSDDVEERGPGCAKARREESERDRVKRQLDEEVWMKRREEERVKRQLDKEVRRMRAKKSKKETRKGNVGGEVKVKKFSPTPTAAGFQAFEESVLQKLKKAAALKQN